MRYYFDQRESEKVNIFVYTDESYYGKIYAKEHCITSVDLPDEAKCIQLSFSDAYNSIEKVKANTMTDSWTYYELDNEKQESDEADAVEEVLSPDLLECLEHEEMIFGYENFVKIPCDEMGNRRWQFPYDIEIDTSVYTGDLVFYPAEFERTELEGGIFYQGRTVEACDFIEMKLKKRICNFDMDTWRTLYLILGVIAFLACAVWVPYALHFYVTEYIPNKAQHDMQFTKAPVVYFCNIIASLGGFIGSIVWLRDKWHYKGMFIEKEMKKEYFVNSEGEVIEI